MRAEEVSRVLLQTSCQSACSILLGIPCESRDVVLGAESAMLCRGSSRVGGDGRGGLVRVWFGCGGANGRVVASGPAWAGRAAGSTF